MSYANMSSIPIVTKTAQVNVRWKSCALLLGSRPETFRKIQTSGEVFFEGVGGRGFAEAYGARRDSSEPPVIVSLDLVYQAIPTGKCNRSRGDIELLGLCSIPGQVHFNMDREKVEAMRCPAQTARRQATQF